MRMKFYFQSFYKMVIVYVEVKQVSDYIVQVYLKDLLLIFNYVWVLLEFLLFQFLSNIFVMF